MNFLAWLWIFDIFVYWGFLAAGDLQLVIFNLLLGDDGLNGFLLAYVLTGLFYFSVCVLRLDFCY